MEVLAKINAFQVSKVQNSQRSNRFKQNDLIDRQPALKQGIGLGRNYAMDFDTLYNPYRLQQIGSLEKPLKKSLSDGKHEKEFIYQNSTNIVHLGRGILKYQVSSAVNDLHFRDQKQKKIFQFELDCRQFVMNCQNAQDIQIQLGLNDQNEEMFGNMQKITSKNTSFVSFTSKSDNQTVFYSFISRNED